MSLGYLKVLLLLSISTLGIICTQYEFRFENIELLKGDTETLIEFNFRLVGRQRKINGTIKCHVDIDDEFEWQIIVEQHINGDWKTIPLHVKNTTCPFMENVYGKFFEGYIMDTNLPNGKDACPIKKGEYYMKNMNVPSDNWMKFGKQGMNRCRLTVSKNNITYGGFIGVAVLTEIPI